jgi:hypothetical protein
MTIELEVYRSDPSVTVTSASASVIWIEFPVRPPPDWWTVISDSSDVIYILPALFSVDVHISVRQVVIDRQRRQQKRLARHSERDSRCCDSLKPIFFRHVPSPLFIFRHIMIRYFTFRDTRYIPYYNSIKATQNQEKT